MRHSKSLESFCILPKVNAMHGIIAHDYIAEQKSKGCSGHNKHDGLKYNQRKQSQLIHAKRDHHAYFERALQHGHEHRVDDTKCKGKQDKNDNNF